MTIESKYCLLAESSWDLECVEQQGFAVEKSFLHNDFFFESNTLNTERLNRVGTLVRIFVWCFIQTVKGNRLIFTSLNSEAMLVAILFSVFRGNVVLIPNVVLDPVVVAGLSGGVLRRFYASFKGRLYVTDEVTLESLKDYDPQLTKHFYTFSFPQSRDVAIANFVVVLPAVLSHSRTRLVSDSYYSYSYELCRFLSMKGRKVSILPHPREEGKLPNDIGLARFGEIISSEAIPTLREPVVYVSAYSSLCLNRRYSGAFGVWVDIPRINLLPDGLKHSAKYLKSIDEL